MIARSASSDIFQRHIGIREPAFPRLVAGSWLDFAILATAVLACFATPLLAFRSAASWSPGIQTLAALAVALACIPLTLALSARLPSSSAKLVEIAETTPFWAIVALGLLLRAVWNLTFPAQAGSDGAIYVSLASRLAAGEPYFIGGTFAYWPVGYPLYLSGWIAALGPGKTAWLASNFALYLIAIVGIGGLVVVGLAPDRRRAILGASAFLLAAAAVIAPWTLRKYTIFDRFVLVSTNGGGNFYRANNPIATGGYIGQGAVDLSGVSEIEQDLRGRRLAVEWIRSHLIQFAQLALEKQLRFAGDDAVGIYGTFKVGNASAKASAYAMLKAAANAFWMLAWITLTALCLCSRKYRLALPPLLRLPLWLWLYLFALHSIFESAGKYHVPAAWVLCVLIAGYAAAAARATARA